MGGKICNRAQTTFIPSLRSNFINLAQSNMW